MTYNLSAIIERDGKFFVAYCPEIDLASQGSTIEEANQNLREAVQLFIESADPSEINVPTEPPFITSFKIAL